MFKDRLRTFLGSGPPGAPAGSPSANPAPRVNGGPVNSRSQQQETVLKRHSPGLEQFFSSIRDLESLSVLDLAGASQANITFITSLGHKIYSDDIVRTLDASFGDGDFFANQGDPIRVGQFMSGTLDFPEEQFGGALVWDTLQFLAPSLLQQTVDQLFHILQPGASMLAFFHAEEKVNTIPVYSYRISDSKTILLASRGQRRQAQFFNNRALEKLFQKYNSVKFFLTRDHLREVIVRR